MGFGLPNFRLYLGKSQFVWTAPKNQATTLHLLSGYPFPCILFLIDFNANDFEPSFPRGACAEHRTARVIDDIAYARRICFAHWSQFDGQLSIVHKLLVDTAVELIKVVVHTGYTARGEVQVVGTGGAGRGKTFEGQDDRISALHHGVEGFRKGEESVPASAHIALEKRLQ